MSYTSTTIETAWQRAAAAGPSEQRRILGLHFEAARTKPDTSMDFYTAAHRLVGTLENGSSLQTRVLISMMEAANADREKIIPYYESMFDLAETAGAALQKRVIMSLYAQIEKNPDMFLEMYETIYKLANKLPEGSNLKEKVIISLSRLSETDPEQKGRILSSVQVLTGQLNDSPFKTRIENYLSLNM